MKSLFTALAFVALLAVPANAPMAQATDNEGITTVSVVTVSGSAGIVLR